MAKPDIGCPKCKARMEEGFVLDRGQYNAASVASWVDGQWEQLTTKKFVWFSTPLRGKKKRPITGYRCASCGYLEAYAK
jgi:hypothetical protein